MEESLYEELKATGLKIDHHCSDLYIKVTPETTRIINKFKYYKDQFVCNLDGKLKYDVFGAYAPYWDKQV